MTTLTIHRSGFFRRDYEISNDDGLLTTLNAGSESQASFELGGVEYQMIRESCVGDFILSDSTGELSRATKPSALFRSFDVIFSHESYTLEARSVTGESYELKQAGEVVGSFDAKGFFTTHGAVTFPASIPLPVQCFMIWLTLLMWQRSKDAASTPNIPVG